MDFKTAIKKCKSTSCPCRACKTYLHGVAFKGVFYTLKFRDGSGTPTASKMEHF